MPPAAWLKRGSHPGPIGRCAALLSVLLLPGPILRSSECKNPHPGSCTGSPTPCVDTPDVPSHPGPCLAAQGHCCANGCLRPTPSICPHPGSNCSGLIFIPEANIGSLLSSSLPRLVLTGCAWSARVVPRTPHRSGPGKVPNVPFPRTSCPSALSSRPDSFKTRFELSGPAYPPRWIWRENTILRKRSRPPTSPSRFPGMRSDRGSHP